MVDLSLFNAERSDLVTRKDGYKVFYVVRDDYDFCLLKSSYCYCCLVNGPTGINVIYVNKNGERSASEINDLDIITQLDFDRKKDVDLSKYKSTDVLKTQDLSKTVVSVIKNCRTHFFNEYAAYFVVLRDRDGFFTTDFYSVDGMCDSTRLERDKLFLTR